MSSLTRTADERSLSNKALQMFTKQKAVVAILAMLLIMLLFGRDSPLPFSRATNFYTFANIMNIFRVASPNIIIAFGVTFAVICRGCDLSVGSVMSLSGIIAIQLINGGTNMALAIAIAILSGTVVGFINGFLIVHQKTEAFIITLGMGILVRGVTLLLTNGNPVPAKLEHDGSLNFMDVAGRSLLGIPNVMLLMILFGVVAFCLLRFTSFGRNCYALGGDYDVAEYSGIDVIRTKWLAFVLCGTYAAIAGVLLASRLNAGSSIYGDEIPYLVNSGVVIGGTSFAGGVGGVPQSFIGIFVMQLLRNCLDMFKIDRYIQMMILGVVIVAIIGMDCLAIKRKKEDV